MDVQIVLLIIVLLLSWFQPTIERRKAALIVAGCTSAYLLLFYTSDPSKVTEAHYVAAIWTNVVTMAFLGVAKSTALTARLGLMTLLAAFTNYFGLVQYNSYADPGSYEALYLAIYIVTIIALFWKDKTDALDNGIDYTVPIIRSWCGWRSDRVLSGIAEV